jgi:ABC-type multidrug transport system ATPase subunit
MGPSGAGKTTFLNTVCKRNLGKKVKLEEGEIMWNAHDSKDVDIQKLSGFVPQDDTLMFTLTPRESFAFSAALRLQHMTKNE